MAADAAPDADVQPKAKIFISYSRKDMSFVDRLEAALKAHGFEPLIDREEIYAFEDWWERLQALIAQADTVVFVLSPDAVASREALREVDYAASLNKRFAPIVCRRVEDAAVPDALRRLNFKFLDDPAKFAVGADQLAEALNTDIGWIRQHTEFGEAARRWATAGRPSPRGLLLRSPVLEEAEQWIISRPSNAPEPTLNTRTFITESRRAATQRRNFLTLGLSIGLVIAVMLAGLAYWQREVALGQEQIAQQQRDQALEQRNRALITQSRFLADQAKQQGMANDGITAALLALEALPDRRSDETEQRGRPLVIQAERALYEGRQRSARELVLPLSKLYAVSADKKLLLLASGKVAQVWDLESGRQIGTLTGHGEPIVTARFSEDGHRAVTTSPDQTARIWDVLAGKEIQILTDLDGVADAQFSRDARYVLTLEKNAVRVWDTTSGAMISRLQHRGEVKDALFAFGGRRIVSFTDQALRLWDVATGQELASATKTNEWVDVSVGPVGSQVAIQGEQGGVRVWDSETGEPPVALEGSSALWTKINSTETRILTCNWENFTLWDAQSGKAIYALRVKTGGGDAAEFSFDGRSLAVALSDVVIIIDADSGARVAELNHAGVKRVAFSKDSTRLLTVSDDDETVRVWNAKNGQLIAILKGHVHTPNTEGMAYNFIAAAQFSADGQRVLTASEDRTARVWDANTGREIALLRGHDKALLDAFFALGEERVVTRDEDSIRLWSLKAPADHVALEHSSGVTSVSFSPNGQQLVTGTIGGTVQVWDLASRLPVLTLKASKAKVYDVAFSPDGSRVVAAYDDRVARVWDTASGREISVLRGHQKELMSARFSPDGRRIVSASDDQTARVWDAESGRELRILEGHTKDVNAAEFSPDGSRIVTGSLDGSVRLWDAETMKLISNWTVCATNHLAFSQDGRYLAVSCTGYLLYLYDAVTGRRVATLTHERPLYRANFSPDGRRIVTISYDRTLRVWDLGTSLLLRTIPITRGEPMDAKFSPDGQQIAVASDNGTVQIWPMFLSTQPLVDDTKAIVPRCLTKTQRDAAFLDDAPPHWCIELEKWPYQTQDWKEWLRLKRANTNPPLPESREWQDWTKTHKVD